MKKVIACVGDVHGQQLLMLNMLKKIEEKKGVEITHVLQVGDFEAVRYESDLETIVTPEKYRHLGEFNYFFDGYEEFPWPVTFIGGNHEAYGLLEEHKTGHELVKNCHYLGRYGHFSIANEIKVSGLTGIYHPELHKALRDDADLSSKRGLKRLTYYNLSDVASLERCGPCDILMIHDWPADIVTKKDLDEMKQTFDPATLGSPITSGLIKRMKPKIVICGHMHLPFSKKVGDTTVFFLNAVPGKQSIALIDEEMNISFAN